MSISTTCPISNTPFTITDEDLAFYKKMGVPAPTLCPDERARRRLIWRNERNLCRRKCSATGKVIISIFTEDKPFPVYEQDYWWGDQWDGKDFGQDIDFSRPFFEQWHELFQKVPQIALNAPMSENSEFTNQCQQNKNCYLVFCSGNNKDCSHGMWNQDCRDCVDCLYIEFSELCYEVIAGKQCYSCAFSQNLETCSDCFFCRNCIGCKNCFGCVNLRNKEYYFLNEKCTPDEYQKKLKDLALHKYSSLKNLHQPFQDFVLGFPQKYYTGKNNENTSGDYLQNNKDALECYNCRDNEHTKFCRDNWRSRNCYDLLETLQTDFCLEVEGSAFCTDCLFCPKVHEVNNLAYCSHCHFSENLFGCVGLKHEKYCILNKSYSEAEYKALRQRLVDHMKQTGEWGEHFPAHLSPFGYNETVAQEYFPLTKAEALVRGFTWKDEEENSKYIGKHFQVPDDIADVTDDLTDQILTCDISGKNYKIQKSELRFYQKMNLPIPRLHPDIRHSRRMALRNPRKLWNKKCDQCFKEITTTFAPDRPEKVLCEDCYLKAVH